MKEQSTNYIHGTSEEEQSRLSLLNDLLNKACLEKLQLQKGDKVLDVGSGLGQFSCLMGRTTQTQVLGIEKNKEQLNKARTICKNSGQDHFAKFEEGSAYHLPLEEKAWGSFDVVHCRFVLEHLKDPEKAVAQMVKAVKPGGRIVLADDDHDICRLYPEPSGFQFLWEAYFRAYDRMGTDPFIGRRLVSMLFKSGAKKVNNSFIFFGDCAGNNAFPHFANNLIGVIEGAKDFMLDQRLIDPRTFQTSMDQLHDWKELPDAAIWYAIHWAEGAF